MFGVSRQVYYRSIRSVKEKQKRADAVLDLVRRVRMEMPRIGTRKLYVILKDDLASIGVGRDKLFEILKSNKMLIKPRKNYHTTTNSHHRFRKHKNLIENSMINKPEQVWVSDITYIGTRKNPMYLSLVTDVYSKKIMGYNVSRSLATEGVLKALNMAISKRVFSCRELIHHSDRGLQYCSDEYQHQLNKYKIRCSMTESYDPYANAVAERINGVLKQEFLEGTQQYDFRIMQKIVQETVLIYNTKRPHISNHMNTPSQMHKQNQIIMRTYKSKKAHQEYS